MLRLECCIGAVLLRSAVLAVLPIMLRWEPAVSEVGHAVTSIVHMAVCMTAFYQLLYAWIPGFFDMQWAAAV